MTPNKNHCIPEQFVFEQVKSCPIVVNFKGKPVTSDAGLTLIAELDRKREIISRLTACFKDYREPNKILHPVQSLIAQRVYALVMGYEDINDHETLRNDPIYIIFYSIFANIIPNNSASKAEYYINLFISFN